MIDDAKPDMLPAQCDLFAQSGCAASDKCTYVHDTDSPTVTGHIGCAPNGTVADKGSCSFSSAPNGYDNCVKGDLCIDGVCSKVCDPMAATNTCGTSAMCGAVAEPPSAGICIAGCDPLADNIFKAGGTKPGTACAAGQGCYGVPSSNPNARTRFTCLNDTHFTANRLTHRSVCDSSSACGPIGGGVYLNGCSQGYVPFLLETTGSTTVVCTALCKPMHCSRNSCGTNAAPAQGAAPHQCNNTYRDGTFDVVTSTNNGDHCTFSWIFEMDGNKLPKSATSDTLGFCIDHKLYNTGIDKNADGAIDQYPPCSDLLIVEPDPTRYNAIEFGCVDSVTAAVVTELTGKPPVSRALELRLPYSWQAPPQIR
jgi:hypothetical protein